MCGPGLEFGRFITSVFLFCFFDFGSALISVSWELAISFYESGLFNISMFISCLLQTEKGSMLGSLHFANGR